MNNRSLVDYAEENVVESIRFILDSVENINQFEYGRSALHAACISNAVDAAKLLV